MPHRKRAATAPGRRPGELRPLVPIAGLATAAVVVISSIDAGLPAGRTASAVVVALTVVALTLWSAAVLRRIPGRQLLAAALLGTGLAGAALDVLRPAGPGFVLAYMAMAGLGLGLPRRPALTCGAVVMVAAAAAEAATSEHPVSAALTLAAGAGALFLAATLAAVSRDAHAQAEALLAQEAATRAAREEAAVLGERQRLARELHDVLAHTLSGLAVQLEGARLLAERTGADPRLAEQVTNARGRAKGGRAGAKRAVATLRGEALPGPEQLPQLVEQTRLTGLPVSLTVTGEARPLPRHPRPGGGRAAARRVRPGRLPRRAGGPPQPRQVRRPRRPRRRRPHLGRRRPHRRDHRLRRRPGRRRTALGRLRAGRPRRAGRARRRAPGRRTHDRRLAGHPHHARRPAPGGPPMTIRVLIADDQKVVRDGLAMLLGLLDGIEVIGTAVDGADAVRQAVSADPDIVLMDLNMPTVDGVEAPRRLVEAGARARVVVLTTYADDDWVFRALSAGARGFLTKDAGAEEIEQAVTSICAGQAQLETARAPRGPRRGAPLRPRAVRVWVCVFGRGAKSSASPSRRPAHRWT